MVGILVLLSHICYISDYRKSMDSGNQALVIFKVAKQAFVLRAFLVRQQFTHFLIISSCAVKRIEISNFGHVRQE